MSNREFGEEYRDIIELLAPLRETVPAGAAEEKLAGLLVFVNNLEPGLTFFGKAWGLISRLGVKLSLTKILSIGILTLFGIMAALVIPGSHSIEQPNGLPAQVELGGGHGDQEDEQATTSQESLSSTQVILSTPTESAVESNLAEPTTAATSLSGEIGITQTPGGTGSGGLPATLAPTEDGSGISESTPTPELSPTPEDTPAPTFTPTPENTPTAIPTVMPSVIVVNIQVPSPGERITGVGRTKFSAAAYDQAVGTSNGAGISYVTFRLSGPNGVFHTSSDSSAPYCEFGGVSVCDSMGNDLWKQLAAGSYTLTVTAYSTSGQSSSRSVSFTVDVN